MGLGPRPEIQGARNNRESKNKEGKEKKLKKRKEIKDILVLNKFRVNALKSYSSQWLCPVKPMDPNRALEQVPGPHTREACALAF